MHTQSAPRLANITFKKSITGDDVEMVQKLFSILGVVDIGMPSRRESISTEKREIIV